MEFQSLFVTGTDTGVGKTVVTALIALKLRQMGVHCGVMKPFASGCELKGGELISEDATFLSQALQLSDSQDEICPIRLEEPLAPLIAARRAGLSTAHWPHQVEEAYNLLNSRYDCVVVEGVGGLLAPIWENDQPRTNLDLIESWGLPTVVVARRSLGTINHTLLTLNTQFQGKAHFAGLIFNDSAPSGSDDIAALTSPDFILENSHVPQWGNVPFSEDLGPAQLELSASRLNISL